jgi:hypothetical protein
LWLPLMVGRSAANAALPALIITFAFAVSCARFLEGLWARR